MPSGMQVWKDDGTLVFDSTDRAGRIVGQITLPNSGSPTTNTVNFPTPCPAGTTPFYVVVSYNTLGYQLTLSVSAISTTQITYNSNADFVIWYGYY